MGSRVVRYYVSEDDTKLLFTYKTYVAVLRPLSFVLVYDITADTHTSPNIRRRNYLNSQNG